jgi:hypothetical protein
MLASADGVSDRSHDPEDGSDDDEDDADLHRVLIPVTMPMNRRISPGAIMRSSDFTVTLHPA